MTDARFVASGVHGKPRFGSGPKMIAVGEKSSLMAVEVEVSGPAIRIGKIEVFAEDAFNSTTPVGGFAISPDGRRLLVTCRVRTQRQPARGLPMSIAGAPGADHRECLAALEE